MCTSNLPGDQPGRNHVVSVEPQQVTVRPEYAVGGVLIEVVDRDGCGFNTILDIMPALDLVLKVGGAIARLRGWSTS